jgi:hypothetical protein
MPIFDLVNDRCSTALVLRTTEKKDGSILKNRMVRSYIQSMDRLPKGVAGMRPLLRRSYDGSPISKGAVGPTRRTGYSNVWLGTTAEDQTRFDMRWKRLKKIPAIVRFISYEPALGPLRLPSNGPLPDWLISGGESGPGARPLKPRWVRDVIRECRHRGVAPFHKQWGSYQNNPLVVEQEMTAREAQEIDAEGKGGAGWSMESSFAIFPSEFIETWPQLVRK